MGLMFHKNPVGLGNIASSPLIQLISREMSTGPHEADLTSASLFYRPRVLINSPQFTEKSVPLFYPFNNCFAF